jgi:hypothetical protein
VADQAGGVVEDQKRRGGHLDTGGRGKRHSDVGGGGLDTEGALTYRGGHLGTRPGGAHRWGRRQRMWRWFGCSYNLVLMWLRPACKRAGQGVAAI